MTDWTEIPNTVFEVGKPARAVDMRALRDNLAAMAEGASGAPRIAQPALGTWFYASGNIGSHVFATYSGAAVALGGTVAGSSLNPTSAVKGAGSSGIPAGAWSLTNGAALAGTWRCMGTFSAATGGPISATLWQRIA